jgi:hypothetical protein
MSVERRRIQGRVGGYDWKNTKVWLYLTMLFGTDVNHQELLSIAQVAANWTNIRLDRDATRRKIVMVKWFEENWAAIYPLLPHIRLD